SPATLFFAVAWAALTAPGNTVCAAERPSADLVVYGGTAGGIVAAVTARKLGASVVILEPSEHVGGMVTGGLGFTDTGLKPTIGGMAAEFHRRLYAHYDKPGSWKHQTRDDFLARLKTGQQPTGGKWWVFEPSVGASVLQGMLDEVQLKVLTGHRLATV